MDHICQEPLGFYLYMNFVRQHGDAILADFLTHVAYYRTLSPPFRLDYALKVMESYLLVGSHPSTVEIQLPTISTLCRKLELGGELATFQANCPLKFMSNVKNPDEMANIADDRQITCVPKQNVNALNIKSDCEPVAEVLLSIHEASVSNRNTDCCVTLYEDELAIGRSTSFNEIRIPHRGKVMNTWKSRTEVADIMVSSSAPEFSYHSWSKVSIEPETGRKNSCIYEGKEDDISNMDLLLPDRPHTSASMLVSGDDSMLSLVQSTEEFDSNEYYLPLELFDKIDVIVWTAVQQHYGEIFPHSKQWMDFFRFKIIYEKKCNEKDFSLFRKLGKGINNPSMNLAVIHFFILLFVCVSIIY